MISFKDFVMLSFLVFRVASQMVWDKISSCAIGFENERIYFAGVAAVDVCFLYYFLKEAKGKWTAYLYSFFLGLASFALVKSLFLNLWDTPEHEYYSALAGVVFVVYQIYTHVRVKRNKN